MPTQNLIHVTKAIFLIITVGLFAGSASKSMSGIADDSPRIDMFQSQDEISLKTTWETIEGEVMRVQGEFVGEKFSQMRDQRYIIRTPFGSEWDLHLEKTTMVVGDIFLGDHVKATVGEDGLVRTVQKMDQDHKNSQDAVVRRRISGTVEKMQGNFIYVRQGDHTEILHLDDQSTLEGDIREGSKIVAQLGDAGYAIRIQKFQSESQTNSN
jgi:hypothetical protein